MTIFSFISLLGGLTFFLFGMKVMSENLEKLAGGKLETMLQKVTSRPLLGITLGAVITIAMQSSSASTVMLVGLVNSGIMKFSQTVYVIFGANIGTTLTAWILSLSSIEGDSIFIQMLKPKNFSPILAFIGIIFVMLSKSDRKKGVGSIFIGFAVLMFGMDMMAGAVSPLAETPEFIELLTKFNNPLVAILIGAVFTGIIQSSAASIAILQALAMSGIISYGIAIPIVMGQNIGTCATSLISSIGTNKNAKRVAVIHTMMNFITTVVCISALSILDAIFDFAFMDELATSGGIAFVHTLFNIIMTAILMPFTKQICRLAELIVKDRKELVAIPVEEAVVLDERLLMTPSVAIAECNNATSRMAQLAQATVGFAEELFENYTSSVEKLVLQTEDELDLCENRIGAYLVKLSAKALSQKDSRQISKMLHVIGDLERLGDHAVNLRDVAKEIYEKDIKFTPELQSELKTLRSALSEILEISLRCYTEDDARMAVQVEPLEEVIDGLSSQIRSNQIAQLQKGNSTIEMGFILSDLLTNYERISDHCSNIAVAVIEVLHESFDAHKYLQDVKFGNHEFNEIFAMYSEKYHISDLS